MVVDPSQPKRSQRIGVGGWTAATVLAAILGCAVVVALHLTELAVHRRESNVVGELRQARLDLHQGRLDVRMGAQLGSPEKREQGLRLLEQARARFHEASKDKPDMAADLARKFGVFDSALAKAARPEASADDVTAMLTSFDELQEYAERLDTESLESLDALASRQQIIFAVVAGLAILLMSGVGALAVQSSRQRQKDNAAIRDSDDRFRRFFDMAPMPISYVDPQGNVLAVNRQFVTTFGYSHEEVPTVTEWRRKAYPDPAYRGSLAQARAERNRAIQLSGESAASDLRVTCKNGRVREIALTSTPLDTGTLNTFLDVTESRRAERAIQESGERFRSFFDLSPLPISNVDRQGNVLAVNRKFVEVFGYAIGEVPTVGDFRQRVYPDPAYREKATALHRALYAKVDETGDSASTEVSVTCKNGRVRDLIVTVTPLGEGFLNTFQDVTERRIAERSIRESEARFRRLFDESPLPKAYIGVDGTIQAINRKLTEMLGYTLADMPTVDAWFRRAYADRSYGEGNRRLWDEWNRNAVSGQSVEIGERQIVCKDGTQRTMELSASTIEGGTIVALVDVTARKRAEVALHEQVASTEAARREAESAQATLAAAISAMSDPFVVVDRNRRFIHLNLAYAHGQGYARIEDCPAGLDELPKRSLVFAEDGRELPDADRPINRALRGEASTDLEFMRKLNNEADFRYTSISAAPVRDASGEVVGAVQIVRDVTRRHKAEEALRAEMGKSERARAEAEHMRGRLEAALGAMADSVLIADATGHYVHINDSFVRYHRFASRSDCPGRLEGYMPLIDMFAADGTWVDFAHRPISRALKGESGVDVEYRVERTDTAEKWVGQYNFAPIRDRDGTIVGAVVTATDITGRKEAEARLKESREQLAQAQKMEAVGQLTGGIAHDFNNLLAVIIGNLELLRPEIPGVHGEMADTALRAATRGAELTQRLLAFSRRQALQPRRIDLNRLVGGMTSLLTRTLGDHIRIETRLGRDVDGASVDPGQLENALLNLAVNARDAMPGGGTLTVTTRRAEIDDIYAAAHEGVRPGAYEAVSVSDTGTGMTPETAARAFDPFFTTKEIGKGTGLGLSMVYGFAKQSGGHAAIYSEPGRGTTVTIYLPCIRSEERADPGAAATLQPRAGSGEPVLVVEDDADIRETLNRQLSAAGYSVELACDGVQALARLSARTPPALLLTDMALPGGIGGIDVADAARKAHPGLPVIFMSGHPLAGDLRERFARDGSPFLQKPFVRVQLLETIAATLNRKGATQ
ncbi:MAG: PAS domain S-box protein [Rhodospirillales bacterium]|nr:PAS domain S-box protein [Rhodospirillales bacterium]